MYMYRNLYIWVCVWVRVCVYVGVCQCVCMCVHVCACVCVWVCVSKCVCVCLYACVSHCKHLTVNWDWRHLRVCVCVCVCVGVCGCVWVCVCAYVTEIGGTYTHVEYTHIVVCLNTRVRFWQFFFFSQRRTHESHRKSRCNTCTHSVDWQVTFVCTHLLDQDWCDSRIELCFDTCVLPRSIPLGSVTPFHIQITEVGWLRLVGSFKF